MHLPARAKSILLEALLVGLGASLLAFGANALSPKGLRLSRNYFHQAGPAQPAPAPSTHSPPASTNTTARPAAELLAEQLRQKGLGLADSNRVSLLFAHPGRQTEQVLFIDARNDEHYLAGHVPGAYQLDYYYPDKYLPAVLQACLQAQSIVVYCNGGDCEDSQFAALMLATAVPKEKLLIYGGGFSEWTTNAMPIEVGQRNSGQLRPASKQP